MGVGLVLMLLVSMLVAVAPVSAGTLDWTAKTGADIPSTTNKIVQADTTLYDMAVSADGQTVYVAAYNSGLYKSTDGGATWSSVTLPTAVTGNVSMVAVAPDNANVVVFLGNTTGLTTNLTAYVSTDGGSGWNSLGTVQDASANAATQLYDVAISSLDGSTRYIACAGTDAGGAALYYFNLGATTPVWRDATSDTNWIGGPPVSGAAASFRAVAFSPNFPSDQVMMGVSANVSTSAGAMRFHIASFNQKQWDANVFDGYPKALFSSANVTSVQAADISVDPEYLGGDDTTRIAFVATAYTLAGTADGAIYRLKDTTLQELQADTQINSVAWDGVNLAAGSYADNNVYRSDDALASSPTVSASRSYKEIGVDDGGNDAVIVRWAGSSLYGIKQGAASAFSKSTDNGKTWNDVALVDSALTTMEDMWVSPDGSVMYLLASDGTETSLWRKASAWTRVFVVANTNGYIVRAADSNSKVVYIADRGNASTRMYYSTDGGVEKWTVRTSKYDISDVAVQDADVAYVANFDNDEVSKTTNGGFTWADDVDSKAGGGTGYTLTLLANDQLILGTTDGYVAYSSDGNGSWTKVSTQLNGSGNAQVTASGLATGSFIYAATDDATTKVQRWEIGQSSTSWKDLSAPTATGAGCYGLLLENGVLYALTANTTGLTSYLMRSLNPTTSTPAASDWTTVTESSATFSNTPTALRLNSGSTELWTINTNSTDALYALSDTLVTGLKITLVAPVAGFQNPINPVSGYSQDIAFSWEKPTTGTIAYEVRIKAADQTTTLITSTKTATDSATPNVLIGPNQGTGYTLSFAPGETYYWQVRATSPVDSPWSDLRKFTIAPLQAANPVVLAPVNGGTTTETMPSFSWSPSAGATKYQFKLANNVGLTSPIVDTTVTSTGYAVTAALEVGKTYYWAVKALEPVEGGWSSIANFKVVAVATVATTPPVTVTQVPAPIITITQPAAPAATTITIPAPEQPAQITPAYIWAIIIIGAILVIAVVVLIVRTRRTV